MLQTRRGYHRNQYKTFNVYLNLTECCTLLLTCTSLRLQIYNKDGRIGIYTPTERAAIIERFMRKRSRRVWNKKIRYDCRKNLADRRLRVKGRFVKRSEQEQLERTHHHEAVDDRNGGPAAKSALGGSEEGMPDVSDPVMSRT